MNPLLESSLTVLALLLVGAYLLLELRALNKIEQKTKVEDPLDQHYSNHCSRKPKTYKAP